MTGTENENIYGHLKRFSRARVTLTVGKPFFLREQTDRQEMMRHGTRQIMESLAELLPENYQAITDDRFSSTEPALRLGEAILL
jgi:hypothetical protein